MCNSCRNTIKSVNPVSPLVANLTDLDHSHSILLGGFPLHLHLGPIYLHSIRIKAIPCPLSIQPPLPHDTSAKFRSSSQWSRSLSPFSSQISFSCRFCGRFSTGPSPQLSSADIPQQNTVRAARRKYMKIIHQSIKQIPLLRSKPAKGLAWRSVNTSILMLR